MDVLFCYVAWMTDYAGVSDDDQPIHSGAYIKEPGQGAPGNNFLDYNGKCYGYFRTARKLALARHYKDVKKNQPYADEVLVVWVAADATQETRIVGWYKHARVYRELQFQEAFTDAAHNLYYNVAAAAQDCFLLPMDQRTFLIPRAASSGQGTGLGKAHFWYADSPLAQTYLIPRVLEYINSYTGEFANEVYSDEMLPAVGSQDPADAQFTVLFNQGARYLEEGDYRAALDLFKLARIVNETPNVLFNIASCMETLYRFDSAIAIYEGLLESEGDKPEILLGLLRCCDFVGNREKTLIYAERVLPVIVDNMDGEISSDGESLKVEICIVMARIYSSVQDYVNSRAAIKKILTITDSEENRQIVAVWEADIDQQLSERKELSEL